MKHISVIVPSGNSIVDTIIAPFNMLKMANSHFKRINELARHPFKVDLVGLSKEPVLYQGLFSVRPTATIHDIPKTDLIIISPISGDLDIEIQNNMDFVDWIKTQRIENGSELASLCKGAFLLAETGLVNGKSCATHWTAHETFKRKYPNVNLIPEKIICEDNGIYSSGGAYSILNFTLYLIERYFGRETAIWCSKVSEIAFDRLSQSEFIIFSGQKDHSDEPIKQAQLHIENNYQDRLVVDEIAQMVHLNARSFLRRFKKATSNTPLEYIQRVKVEAAKKRLESSTKTILEIMYDIGYNDEKAFRSTFRKYSGLSPKEYQRKYNREMAYA
ncbi:GlxA family transcriptional regulator [Allomuricauda sp. SCSIO 65647]|uniref:GlxA family transcriptional regulator n=1 Tax=Allomuricauda sp. SCSIO 65647 TaxID=2908843 RepID=UPI001F2E6F5C|nr:helix-turn-helix domain-containing protein [Muricauda sp. SCSIO 65647]UJH66540.1 helix-turn-helix domain-containing protein [Muricauda sp. SCSIO 65647]